LNGLLSRTRRWCLQNEWLSELGFVPLAVIFSWGLLAIKGVPLTHDGMGFVFVEAYRRAYLAGDYFPLWTPFGLNGHGSAIFILYHRLHAQLAAVLALKTGTVVAVKASVPFWLTIGGIGMRRLCRFHGVRPWVAWISGTFIMSALYTTADWYIRGATAEMVAFMLVPWGLRYASELYERRWGAVRLAVASILIFFAHMITFYFFVVTAAVVVATNFVRLRAYGWARIRMAVVRSLAFVAMLTCAIGPWAAAVTYVTAFSGIGKLGLRTRPQDFGPYKIYFLDPSLSWTRTVFEGEMSLEIGRWCLLCVGVFLLLAPGARASVWRRAGGLALLAAWFVALQHYGMTFWFEMLPGATKIQFPGRLLVLVVSVAILCMALATEAALRSPVPVVRLLACVLPVLGAAFQGNQTRGDQSAIWGFNVDRTVADEALRNEDDLMTSKLSMSNSWGEFLPHLHGLNPPLQPFVSASDGCFVSSPGLTQGRPVNQITKNAAGPVTFTVIGKGCTVKINQIESTLWQAELSHPGKLRAADDGMMLVDAPIDGTIVHLRNRSVLDLAKKFLVEKLRRFP
jgi:hypothetical protein